MSLAPPHIIAAGSWLRRARERRIENFRNRQRQSREWINFREIAEWCARGDGNVRPNARSLRGPYLLLESDLLNGEFETADRPTPVRSRVLFLNPQVNFARMTRERYRNFVIPETQAPEGFLNAGKLTFLAGCWIPRGMCERWFEAKRQPLPSWLAEFSATSRPVEMPLPIAQIGETDRSTNSEVIRPPNIRVRRPSGRARLSEALASMHQEGEVNIGAARVADLHRLALNKAGIAPNGADSSHRTFQRALREARQRILGG